MAPPKTTAPRIVTPSPADSPWFAGFSGNGKAVPYTAECLGWVTLLLLALVLKVNLFLFSDSLSLISQVLKIRRLKRFPSKRCYMRFGILVERIIQLLDQMDKEGLRVCTFHVYSHTDDATPKEDRNANKPPVDEAELQAKWSRLFRRRRSDLEPHLRLSQFAADEMDRHLRVSEHLQLLLEQGHDISNVMLDTKVENSEAELAELLLQEADRLTPDSAVPKSVEDKIAIMDDRYGVTARTLAVKLNRIADTACEGFQEVPTQFGPFCPTVLKYAIANHQGVPCQGYLAETLTAITRDCSYRKFAPASSGKLIGSPNVNPSASVFPLLNGTSGKRKLVKSTWTGRALGDLNFKLLSNSLRSGSKASATGARASQSHVGSFPLCVNGPLHDKADLTEAVIANFRTHRGLPVYPTLFPTQPGNSRAILVKCLPGKVRCELLPETIRIGATHQQTSLSNAARTNLLQEVAKEHVMDSSYRKMSVRNSAGIPVELRSKTTPICLLCYGLETRFGALNFPLASTRHTLSLCPRIGPSIASLLREISEIAAEHNVPHVIPWFTTSPALDWALYKSAEWLGPSPTQISSGIGARIREYARRLHYSGDDDLRSWTTNFFRSRFIVSDEVHAWRREWGDRGAMPEKWPSWEEGVFLPDLLLKRLKIAFLQHKSLLWSKYCRLQRFADSLLSAEAATIFREAITVPAPGPPAPVQGPLDRFVKPWSQENMVASFTSSLGPDSAPVTRSQRKMTDFGFEIVRQQTASAVDADHNLVVDLTSDPDLDPSITTSLNDRGDRPEFEEVVGDVAYMSDTNFVYDDSPEDEAPDSGSDLETFSKPDYDRAPDELDSLTAYQFALDELSSNSSDTANSSDPD
jgi:hypothetical protein